MADASVKVTASSAAIVHLSASATTVSIAAAGLSGTNAISTALSYTGNLARYPRCDATLLIAPTAAVVSTSTNIYLYRRDINVQLGTTDDGIPTISNRNKFVGAFTVPYDSATASTTHTLTIVDVPLGGACDCEFYIENALGVNIPGTWSLTILPKTDVGATT